MCNFIFGNTTKNYQRNVWENQSIAFWNHNYLSHVRVWEPIINTYYADGGSYVTNNGYGYISKSKVERSLIQKLLTLKNVFSFINMKQRYDRHAVTVEQLQQFRRSRKRINKANANRKTIRLTMKQTEIFSDALKDRVLAKGHKIAS